MSGLQSWPLQPGQTGQTAARRGRCTQHSLRRRRWAPGEAGGLHKSSHLPIASAEAIIPPESSHRVHSGSAT
ncbi:MAG: hypothetical protein ACT4OM_05740 [Actinomycetota bacterium]